MTSRLDEFGNPELDPFMIQTFGGFLNEIHCMDMSNDEGLLVYGGRMDSYTFLALKSQ